VPVGWKLYLIAVGLGLVAYGAVDRERGPAYVGLAVLAAFVILTGPPVSARGTLVGWPGLLLVVGGAGLAIGLRPRRPLPPEPSTAEAGSADAGRAVPIDPHDRGAGA
jgi:Sec-independent protein secretion pathway component TatC